MAKPQLDQQRRCGNCVHWEMYPETARDKDPFGTCYALPPVPLMPEGGDPIMVESAAPASRRWCIYWGGNQ